MTKRPEVPQADELVRWVQTLTEQAEVEPELLQLTEYVQALLKAEEALGSREFNADEIKKEVRRKQRSAVVKRMKRLTKRAFAAVAKASFDPAPIQELMDALDMSQNQFATAIGTSSANVSRWLSGKPEPGARFYFRMTALADRHYIDWHPVKGIRTDVDGPRPDR